MVRVGGDVARRDASTGNADGERARHDTDDVEHIMIR